MNNLITIIKEEFQKLFENYYSDWETFDEPSLADKMYNKKYGTGAEIEKPTDINAELIGYVTKQFTLPLTTPIPVYKNPRNLNGFGNNTRAVLLANGDLYVAKNANAMHDNILDLLTEKRIIPFNSKFDYDVNMPEEFVAVQRSENSNTFGQSMAYLKDEFNDFPIYYREMFSLANSKQPYDFKVINV